MAHVEIINERGEPQSFPILETSENYLTEYKGTWGLESKPANRAKILLINRPNFGWVLFADQSVMVNGMRVPDFKLVAEGDKIRIENTTLKLITVSPDTIQAGSPLLAPSTPPCPYDSEPFLEGQKVVFCPVCGGAHHAECWEAMQKDYTACGFCGAIHKKDEPRATSTTMDK